MELGEEEVAFSWNLTHDYDLEQFPDDISRCLQTALLSQHTNSQFIPHYTGFYKSGMTVSLQVSTLPIKLRLVIGNRACMERFGATLMNTLIEGYLTIKKSKVVLRGL